MKPSTETSWADDLCHPLPLAAVGVLAVNDHLLKGSGLLPGWLTGKLSDFAGLFFFPLLLAAMARGAARLAGRGDLANRRALAAATGTSTAVVFTLLKLSAPFNAWVTGVWGVNSMDVTDLLALPMIPLSALFMLRARRAPTPRRHDTRRWLDFAAVAGAGLASMATSQAQPPQRPPQPQVASPVAVVAAPARDTCASLAVEVCETSPTRTLAVIKATGAGPGECTVSVAGATGYYGGELQPADGLPAPVVVSENESATFSLAFPRSGNGVERNDRAVLRIDVRRGLAGADPKSAVEVLVPSCVPR